MTSILIIILEIEDALFTWVFANFPIIATYLGLIILASFTTWWVRGLINENRNSFIKIESDCSQLKAFTKRQQRYNKGFNRRLNSIDRKLDRLIVHLQVTEKIKA